MKEANMDFINIIKTFGGEIHDYNKDFKAGRLVCRNKKNMLEIKAELNNILNFGYVMDMPTKNNPGGNSCWFCLKNHLLDK